MNEELEVNYLMVFGPAAVIACGSIISGWITARKTTKFNKTHAASGIKDPVTRATSIIAAGFSMAAILVLVNLFIDQNSLGKQVFELKEDPHNFTDFPSLPTEIKAYISKVDKEAAAILDGAGGKEWRNLKVGDFRYADEWKWVDIVVPDSNSVRIDEDTCGLEAKAKLTVAGFNIERNLVLVHYTVPSGSSWGGTPCDPDTYFFYPLPR